MLELAIEQHFLKIIDDDKNMSNGIAAIKTLLAVLEKSNCEYFIIVEYFCSSNNLKIVNLIKYGFHNSLSR